MITIVVFENGLNCIIHLIYPYIPLVLNQRGREMFRTIVTNADAKAVHFNCLAETFNNVNGANAKA